MLSLMCSVLSFLFRFGSKTGCRRLPAAAAEMPEHMAHFLPVVIAADLLLPIASYHFQGIVETQQVFHLVVVTHSRQLVAELLGGGDLRGQPDDLD